MNKTADAQRFVDIYYFVRAKYGAVGQQAEGWSRLRDADTRHVEGCDKAVEGKGLDAGRSSKRVERNRWLV